MILSDEAVQFAEQFPEIIRNPEYRKLLAVPRHGSTNTYDHSIRVAQMAYRLAPALGIDAVSAARVGLLHDFCLIDYHQTEKDTSHGGRWYCFYHPEDALENSARQGFLLSEKEKRAILSHMFPLSTSSPSSRLGFLLTLSDKTIALKESWMNAVESYERFCFLLNAGRLKALRILRRNTYERFFDPDRPA